MASPALALWRLLSSALPRPLVFPQMYQGVRDVFVLLETRVGHLNNSREEYAKQEGRVHVHLTKALFHSEPSLVHPVAEPNTCLHDIVELTNDRDHILWHVKTGEYYLEEGSIDGAVRFGKVDKVYIRRKWVFCANSRSP